MKVYVDSMNCLTWWKKNRALSHAREFEEEFRQWLEEKSEGWKKKKVERVFVEAVQVCHKLWSDNEDEGVSTVHSTMEPPRKKYIHSDEKSRYLVTSATKFSYEHHKEADNYSDGEDSEDEAGIPIEDKPVFPE